MTPRLATLILVAVLAACTVKEAPPAGAPQPIPAPPDVAAPPPDALRTPSGLASKVLQVGLGSFHPTMNSRVRAHYTGWTADGRMFQSSVLSGQPIEFQLDGVIPGWAEGVQLMVMGEKRRFWIPANLAYGENPAPPTPAGQLCFDIELLDIR
jgi:peptidylprolyl isomerase